MKYLTERELNVLFYLASGLTNNEISSVLNISVHTTKAHLESIFEKLGVKIEFNGHSDEFIEGAQFCILSPSIPDDAEILKRCQELGINVKSATDELVDDDSVKNILKDKDGVVAFMGCATMAHLIENFTKALENIE